MLYMGPISILLSGKCALIISSFQVWKMDKVRAWTEGYSSLRTVLPPEKSYPLGHATSTLLEYCCWKKM